MNFDRSLSRVFLLKGDLVGSEPLLRSRLSFLHASFHGVSLLAHGLSRRCLVQLWSDLLDFLHPLGDLLTLFLLLGQVILLLTGEDFEIVRLLEPGKMLTHFFFHNVKLGR